jgi:hypothetical protein
MAAAPPSVLYDSYVRFAASEKTPLKSGRGRLVVIQDGAKTKGAILDLTGAKWHFEIAKDSFPGNVSSGTVNLSNPKGISIRYGKLCTCSMPGNLSSVAQTDLVAEAKKSIPKPKKEPEPEPDLEEPIIAQDEEDEEAAAE